MIELTEQQARAIEQPDAAVPRLVHPRTRQRFVVLREDEYERLMGYDGGSWTDEEKDSVRAEALEALGWEGMDAYQDDQP